MTPKNGVERVLVTYKDVVAHVLGAELGGTPKAGTAPERKPDGTKVDYNDPKYFENLHLDPLKDELTDDARKRYLAERKEDKKKNKGKKRKAESDDEAEEEDDSDKPPRKASKTSEGKRGAGSNGVKKDAAAGVDADGDFDMKQFNWHLEQTAICRREARKAARTQLQHEADAARHMEQALSMASRVPPTHPLKPALAVFAA